ncbi:MAG TPA: hypothetical protein VFQ68_04745 [Streptosporangiaceae bacterium]|nr:hypothetical protein [Streptosporangiaceae bacterium]
MSERKQPGLGGSEPASLERGYRRLLAWYPAWFRLQNEEEILAVLLACAQDRQRRPSAEAAADLLKGAARMWMRPRPGQPRTVFAAIRLMWAAALAELGVAITILASLGSVRAAVLHAYPPAWHQVHEQLLVTAVEAPLVIGLWLWMARANGQGKNRGRAAVAVLSGIVLLAVLDAVSAGGITYAPADTAAGMVHGLVALAVVFLVFNPASSRHYRTSMRNRSSLA